VIEKFLPLGGRLTAQISSFNATTQNRRSLYHQARIFFRHAKNLDRGDDAEHNRAQGERNTAQSI
jgi:hypothetical protein